MTLYAHTTQVQHWCLLEPWQAPAGCQKHGTLPGETHAPTCKNASIVLTLWLPVFDWICDATGVIATSMHRGVTIGTHPKHSEGA